MQSAQPVRRGVVQSAARGAGLQGVREPWEEQGAEESEEEEECS